MKKLYIAAFNDYTEQFSDIVIADSEELLLKQLEEQFCHEVEFKTKEDVENHIESYYKKFRVSMGVEYKVVDLE